ncbi:MAG: hypothetical protein KDK10_00925 [Maritimibacter sp.]|nr:hypothetical protein [Maritimibacter sp.]
MALIEFATRGDKARALEALLATLGLEKAGARRNKALSLWRQGEVRIVLNE